MGRKVFVIMGNDFPDSVVSSQKAADEYIEARKAVDKAMKVGHRIYWRSYEFEIDKLKGGAR